jgi:uncharacterized protein YecT (DUF1311 family)
MSPKLILAIAFLAAPLPAWSQGNCTNLDESSRPDCPEAIAFFGIFQTTLRENDRKTVSSLISYPLLTRIRSEAAHIRTPAELLQHFDEIFDAGVRCAVLNATARDVWGNYRGFMIGHGAIWFEGMTSPDRPIKVITVNNGSVISCGSNDPGQPFPPQPSFSCANARTPTEKLVCRDEAVAAMDKAMAEAYRSALRRLPNDSQAWLRREQLSWFRQYAEACDFIETDAKRKECVVQHLGSRTQELASDQSWIKQFLQNYLKQDSSSPDTTARFLYGTADLAGDGKRYAIVCVSSREWCGSGGCTTLVLAPAGSSWKVITRVLIGNPPIRVLSSKSNGWCDLAVQVEGGGILQPYEAALSFNGRSYRVNPTVPPARQLTREVEGEIVVPQGKEGIPVY